MQMENHENSDGRKVWLTEEEVDEFLATAETTEKKIAFGLGARCGLRAHEITAVTPRDLAETPAGMFVRVQRGKGDKYRETPVPEALATKMETMGEIRDEDDSTPLVNVSTRTVERWVDRAAEQLAEETDDDGWLYLTPHDLRRTWGTLLCEREVEPGLVMTFGGWEDWDTFREAYLGQYSPKAQARAIEKVPWL